MASLAVTNTLSSGATILASEHNTNYSDIVTYVNNRNSGSSSWDALYSLSTSTVPLRCDNSTGTQNIANFYDNGTEVLVIKDGGNIGIGSTSPFTKLANSATNFTLSSTGAGTNSILWRSAVAGYTAVFSNDANAGSHNEGGIVVNILDTTNNATPANNAIIAASSNSVLRFIVQASGNVQVSTGLFTVLAPSNDNTTGLAVGGSSNLLLWQDGSNGLVTAGGNDLYLRPTSSSRYVLMDTGIVAVGTTSPNASAIFQATSTTKGFLPPRMTTGQRDAISTPASGLVVYNTSTNKLNLYTGSAWEAVTSV